MKKVIIFTASTGGGHNEAARNLKAEYKDKGYKVVIYDFLGESSKILNMCIAEGYDLLALAMPYIYGNLYKITDKQKVNDMFIKKIAMLIENKVHNKIKKVDPDLIIGTHPFAVAIISKLKNSEKIDVPFISIITDFVPHYTYIDENVDLYITGSEHTKNKLIEKDIIPDKIFPFGIPTNKKFKKEINIKTRKNKDFTVLLMAGSLGLNGIKKVVKKLIENTNKLNIIVICGKNDKLKKRLEKKYQNEEFANKNVKIIGYTKKVPYYMEISDVLITKPGGLTVSEAIIKKLPMIIPFAIPGQEEGNVRFLTEQGVAFKVSDSDEINLLINLLIGNESILEAMKESLERLRSNHSIEKIIEKSEKLISNKARC